MTLRFERVSKHFGGLSVLTDVSLLVPEGSIFGLIGPNGAGKTTLLNSVSGLLAPTSGRITLHGHDLVGLPPHRIARLGVARTFQNIRVFGHMSLLANVMVGLQARRVWGGRGSAERQARDRAHELLALLGLSALAEKAADSLSYGDQRKLELARALAMEPRLLLLDEPVAGMNAAEKQSLMAQVRRIREQGCTVLMIEHDMRFVMGLCDRIGVLNFGQLIAQGLPEEIQRNPQVIEAYLGHDDETEPAVGGLS